MDLQIGFYSTIISTILTTFVLINVMYIRKKQEIHIMFLLAIEFVIIWSINTVMRYLLPGNGFFNSLVMSYIGICLLPPCFLLTAYFFSHSDKSFKFNQILLFIIPFLTLILAATNAGHKLFVVKPDFLLDLNEYGPYFIIHSIYSYGCTVLALFYFIKFAVNNSGFFSKQAVLIILGSAVPLAVNILGTVKIMSLSEFELCSSFSVTMIFFWLAIIRYDFLNVLPVALQLVVNQISDGFLLVNKDYLLMDYNITIETMFSGILTLKKKEDIFVLTKKMNLSEEKIRELSQQAANERRTLIIEKEMRVKDFDKHFIIEITPMYSKKKYIGTIYLFKDITESKQYLIALESKNRELDDVNAALNVQNEIIELLNVKFKELAETDALTAVYNRRFFDEYYGIEMKRAVNQVEHNLAENMRTTFCVAILDIDDFKKVNDNFGHLAGDHVLVQLAQIVKTITFERDIVCRYGGEEFVILFTKTNREGAVRTAEKIRAGVEKQQFAYDEATKNLRVTVSIGFAAFGDGCETEKNNVIKLADDRLYIAKKTGKNKVIYE